MEKTPIRASDYKGKWFVLEDGYNGDAPHIDVEWATGDGLREHVERSRYYGIPAYIGKDKQLNARIEAIEKELNDAEERLLAKNSPPSQE